MEREFEAALHDLIDRDAILQVLMRYARGLDRLDDELARGCYWDDAIEDHGRFVGTPEGFIAWARSMALGFRSTHHAITNHSCEIDGDDAHAETYFVFTAVAGQPPHFMSTGRYVDHFQRRAGVWRIANRVVVVEGTYDLPDSAASAALPPAYAPHETDPATRDRRDVSYHRPLMPRVPQDRR